ncbi:ROK family protein [Halalkalibacter sp. APA_J-10(15)]|uniref:ROK family protein n=1 Tax=Halalkalibacter sp. APA_J-10(15) TaxID=2933805 RepID=UPI00207682A8|nr:ROK family protein [Halalkalibacter sp. APA_J-10(15)]
MVKQIANSIDQKLSQHCQSKEKLLGLGVGVPGIVNSDEGIFYTSVNIEWSNYPSKKSPKDKIRLPVYIEYEADLAVLGRMQKDLDTILKI